MERGGVQAGAIAPSGLEARFVVPDGLIVVGLEAAEVRQVRTGAQARVQRIVDAAQAKSPRDLGVPRQVVRDLKPAQQARAEAIGVGAVHLQVAVREEPAGVKGALLLPIVPTPAERQRQAVGQRIGGLAKDGDLGDVVGQVGVVWAVGEWIAVHRRRRNAGPERGIHHGVIPRHRQALRVVSLDVRVEQAEEPLQTGPFVGRGQANLLGELVKFRGVPQIGGNGHLFRRESQIHRDAPGQRRGVAADQQFAAQNARYRRQVEPIKGRRQRQVEKRGFIVEPFVKQQMLFPFAELNGWPCGGVRVGE